MVPAMHRRMARMPPVIIVSPPVLRACSGHSASLGVVAPVLVRHLYVDRMGMNLATRRSRCDVGKRRRPHAVGLTGLQRGAERGGFAAAGLGPAPRLRHGAGGSSHRSLARWQRCFFCS